MKENESTENQPIPETPRLSPSIGPLIDECRRGQQDALRRSGMFRIRRASQTLIEAAGRPNPEPLWMTLWHEGEVCCLFSDSNLGKSIYAVQIASHIALKQKVLYFDFELSDKQFQLRYTDEQGNLFPFPDHLYRVEIDPEALQTVDFEEAIVRHLEQAAVETGAKVLIIDNLTYLCLAAEKGDLAGELMFRLMRLKRQHGLSLMILAHTPKRPLSSPITQNDLAGSKKLYNFFDSVFAIGKSARDSGLRYIKQLKVRYGDFSYDAGNVIVASIEKREAFLQFTPLGYATEREHLTEPEGDGERQEKVARVKALHAAGRSQREIAREVGVSVSSVNKYIKW